MLSNRAHKPCSFVSSYIHCEKGKIVLTQYVYLSVLLTVCIVKHSGVPLPALDSTQIKNLVWFSRTLVVVTRTLVVVTSFSFHVEKEVTKIG